MPRLRARLLLILVAGLCLGQSASELVTPAIRRVGDKLACLCGSCKNTVATCQMIGCHYSSPAREKIAKMQAEGKQDQEIIDSFVKAEGLKALAVPPAEGFNLLGWWMPPIAIGIGLGMIFLFVKRKTRPVPALPQMDKAVLDKYHDQIEKDLAKFE